MKKQLNCPVIVSVLTAIGISVIGYFWTGFEYHGISNALFWMGFLSVVLGVGISGPTYKTYLRKEGVYDRTQAFQGLGKEEMSGHGMYSDQSVREDRNRFKQGMVVIVYGFVLVVISYLLSSKN